MDFVRRQLAPSGSNLFLGPTLRGEGCPDRRDDLQCHWNLEGSVCLGADGAVFPGVHCEQVPTILAVLVIGMRYIDGRDVFI